MPCWPVFKGPFLPLAASIISFLALASMDRVVSESTKSKDISQDVPALSFCWCASSSSSSSFLSFFAVFKGLTLPPEGNVNMCLLGPKDATYLLC